MINSLIHHLGIGLQSPENAEKFFDTLLVNYLGMIKEETTEAVAGWKGRGLRIYLYSINNNAICPALCSIWRSLHVLEMK